MATNFGEIGVTGLVTTGGMIRYEFLRELTGREGAKRYREMAWNSPIVGAMLAAIEYAIRRIDWNFESDDGADDERLTLLNDARDALTTSWNDHISEALSMLTYGWSLFEIVYQRDEGGRILWRKFAIRGQDTLDKWEFSPEGGLSAFVQRAAPTYTPTTIPMEKCLLYRTRVERNNPEGRSLLRNAWTPYYFLKNIQSIEAIGIERDLCGMPVITLPSGADTADTAGSDFGIAKSLVRNIRNDEQAGVVLPGPDWKLELLSTGGSRQFDTDAIIRRYEARILMTALAQFLLLGQDNVGSLALSRDQTDFFNMSVEAIADQIAEVITKYAIPRLCKLNGVDPAGLRLGHSPAGDPDISGMGTFLQQVGSLITWMPADEVYLRSMAGLPEVDPETIEEEREKKQEQQLEMFRQRGNQFGNDNRESDAIRSRDNRRDNQDDGERQDRQTRMSAKPVPAQTIGNLIEILERIRT